MQIGWSDYDYGSKQWVVDKQSGAVPAGTVNKPIRVCWFDGIDPHAEGMLRHTAGLALLLPVDLLTLLACDEHLWNSMPEEL